MSTLWRISSVLVIYTAQLSLAIHCGQMQRVHVCDFVLVFHCDCVLSLIRGSTTSLVNWSSLSVLGRREKSTTSKLLREHVILNYYVPHISEKIKVAHIRLLRVGFRS